MLFYKKETTMPTLNRKEKILSFGGFRKGKTTKKGIIYPEKCLDFRFCSGILQSTWGTKPIFDDNPLNGYDVKSAWVWGDGEDERLVFSTVDSLYAFPLKTEKGETPEPTLLWNQGFADSLRGIRYITSARRQVLLLYDGKRAFLYNGVSILVYPNAPEAITGCVYYDRIISVSSSVPYRIYFSMPLIGDGWSAGYAAGGYIDLSPEHGQVYALFSIDRALYAFRKRGFTELHTEGENKNFTATPMSVSFGTFFEGSAQTIGKKFIFAASDGLYSFDGKKLEKIATDLFSSENLAEDCNCLSGVHGGFYILCYTLQSGERQTLFWDVEREAGWVSAMHFEFLADDGNRCYLSDGGVFATFINNGIRLKGPLKKVWESGYTQFGLESGRKILRKLAVAGKGNFILAIRGGHDLDERVYTLVLDGEKTIRPSIKSTGFFLTVESTDADCRLETVTVTVDFLKEGR